MTTLAAGGNGVLALPDHRVDDGERLCQHSTVVANLTQFPVVPVFAIADRHGLFVWFIEGQCEVAASDRGLREMIYSEAYAGSRIDTARLQLVPLITNLVERARNDGYLRADIQHTDTSIIGLLAGTVSEWAGHVDPGLFRRYVALLLEGMRHRPDQQPLAVAPLDEDQMHAAMHGWVPAG